MDSTKYQHFGEVIFLFIDRFLFNMFFRQILQIDDKNNSLLSLISSSMPDHIQRNLLDSLEIIFPGVLKDKDTSSEGSLNSFLAVHFSWYNCFSENVGEFEETGDQH